MNHQDFLTRLKQSKDLPKTAAPSPEWFKETFKALAAEAETILCIHHLQK
jgi:fatty acid-binding protein DegV